MANTTQHAAMMNRLRSYIGPHIDINQELIALQAQNILDGRCTLAQALEFIGYSYRGQHDPYTMRWYDRPDIRCIEFENGTRITYDLIDEHDPDNCKMFECYVCATLPRGRRNRESRRLPSEYGRGPMDEVLRLMDEQNRARINLITDYYRFMDPEMRIVPVASRTTDPPRTATEQNAIATNAPPANTHNAGWAMDMLAAGMVTPNEARAQASLESLRDDWMDSLRTISTVFQIPAERLKPELDRIPKQKPEPVIAIVLAPLGGRRIVLE